MRSCRCVSLGLHTITNCCSHEHFNVRKINKQTQFWFLTKLFFYFAVQKSLSPTCFSFFFSFKLFITEDFTGLLSIQYCCSTHLVLLKQLQSTRLHINLLLMLRSSITLHNTGTNISSSDAL